MIKNIILLLSSQAGWPAVHLANQYINEHISRKFDIVPKSSLRSCIYVLHLDMECYP